MLMVHDPERSIDMEKEERRRRQVAMERWKN